MAGNEHQLGRRLIEPDAAYRVVAPVPLVKGHLTRGRQNLTSRPDGDLRGLLGREDLDQQIKESRPADLADPQVADVRHDVIPDVDLAINGPTELADLADLDGQLAPQPDLAALLADRMPQHVVRLAALAATLTSQQVTHYRAGASDGAPETANRLAVCREEEPDPAFGFIENVQPVTDPNTLADQNGEFEELLNWGVGR
jgi:hypothetical protein